jgi:hypothetical protein
MDVLYIIHSTFGERVLPLLIIIAAIWFTIAWKPGSPPNRVARLFPVLVDIQFALGLIWWIYGIVAGFGTVRGYLGWPFILHPIFGLISVGIAHMAVVPNGPFSRFGRWGVLIGLVLLLISVGIGIAIGMTAGRT